MSQGEPNDTPKPVMRFGRVVQITIPELQLHAKHVRLEVLPRGVVRVTPSCLSGVGVVIESFIEKMLRDSCNAILRNSERLRFVLQ